MKETKRIKFLSQSAAVAALYVVLTFVASAMGLSSGAVQLRLSEALCVLPIFMPASVWGLFAGCFLANILTGCVAVDVVCGSIATLIGAVFTRLLRKNRVAALLPPIVSNMLIVPFVLKYAYGFQGSVVYFMTTVGAGELLSCGVLGYLLALAIEKQKGLKF